MILNSLSLGGLVVMVWVVYNQAARYNLSQTNVALQVYCCCVPVICPRAEAGQSERNKTGIY